MKEPESKILIPRQYLSDTQKKVSSYSLMKFIECIHLVMRYQSSKPTNLQPSEASLLHCLYLAGWAKGKFTKAQSILGLQAGASIQTVSRWLAKFEKAGLIGRRQRNRTATEFTLQQCELTRFARSLFLDDMRREQLVDQFVAEAWRSRTGETEQGDADDLSLNEGVAPRVDPANSGPEPFVDQDRDVIVQDQDVGDFLSLLDGKGRG